MPEQQIETPAPTVPVDVGEENYGGLPLKNPEPLLVSDALLEQAEKVCHQRLASNPNHPTTIRSLAQIYRKQGRLKEALPLFERLCQLDPADLQAEYLRKVLVGQIPPVLPAGMRPAPFVFIENFLPREFHETLLPFAIQIKEQLIPAKVANGGDGAYKPETRESLHFPGEWEMKNRFRGIIRRLIPEIAARLHVPPFEILEAEVKMRVYLDGHFFRLHMDCPAKDPKISNRRISYVYFFQKEPRAYTGGDLLLFDTDVEQDNYTTSGFTRVVPRDNSIIIFPSAYWHSVIPVKCPSKEYVDSRFVINGHISAKPPESAEESKSSPAAVAQQAAETVVESAGADE